MSLPTSFVADAVGAFSRLAGDWPEAGLFQWGEALDAAGGVRVAVHELNHTGGKSGTLRRFCTSIGSHSAGGSYGPGTSIRGP